MIDVKLQSDFRYRRGHENVTNIFRGNSRDFADFTVPSIGMRFSNGRGDPLIWPASYSAIYFDDNKKGLWHINYADLRHTSNLPQDYLTGTYK